MRVETERVYVEERNESSICMCSEFREKLGSNRRSGKNKGIWLEDVRLGEP